MSNRNRRSLPHFAAYEPQHQELQTAIKGSDHNAYANPIMRLLLQTAITSCKPQLLVTNRDIWLPTTIIGRQSQLPVAFHKPHYNRIIFKQRLQHIYQ